MICYVLKCDKNMYYVGKTNRDLNTRFNEHLVNSTCSFTSKYKPISILYSVQIDNENIFYEDNLVKKYMLKYGINNVRGGSYSTINLSKHEIKCLKKELFSSIDGCFRCGRTNHFSNKCYANTDIFGETLVKYSTQIYKDKETSSEYSEDSEDSEDDVEMIVKSIAKSFKGVFNYFSGK